MSLASRVWKYPLTQPLAYGSLAIGLFATLNEYKPVPGVVIRLEKSAVPVDQKLRETSTSDLMRSYLVYSACQVPWIVDNSPKILGILTSLPVVRSATEFAVRHTFFQQFVGGDTALECLPVVRKLRRSNIGTLFSYSVEATEEEVNAAAAAGGGSYATRRKNAEDHVVETIRAIVVSGSENKRYFEEEGVKSEGEVGSTWVACKMTGLISDPSILQRASNTILAIRAQHPSKSSYVYYPGTPANTEFSLLARPSPTIDLPSIPDGVTPSDLEELRLLHSDLRKIMGTARQWGVRIVMDAEHSWFQPGIDTLTTMLANEFNQIPTPIQSIKPKGSIWKWFSFGSSSSSSSIEHPLEEVAEEGYPLVQPLVYGTYQAYLRRNPSHLIESLRHAKANNYSLGVKIVRGAYHNQETHRWVNVLHNTSPVPVWPTKPETDACYDSGIEILLDEVVKDIKNKTSVPRVGVMFATHNGESVQKVIGGLVRRRLARPAARLGGGGEESESGKGVVGEPRVLDVGRETRKRVSIGQLYGMCDTLTNATSATFSPRGAPMVVKYLPYGALSEVMPYLGRRAIENKAVLKGEGGAKDETERCKTELLRRWFGYGHYE